MSTRDTTEVVRESVVQQVQKEPDTTVYIDEQLKYTMDTGVFDKVTTLPLKSDDNIIFITGANKRNMWGLSNNGQIFELVKHGLGNNRDWKLLPTQGLRFININSSRKKNILFGVTVDAQVYRYNSRDKTMERMPVGVNNITNISPVGKNKAYAVASDGSAYLLNLKRRLGRNETVKIGDHMKWISAGGKHRIRGTEVWAIGHDNQPYRWRFDLWVKYPLDVRDISVTRDNAVYAVGTNGGLYKWNGRKEFIRQSQTYETGLEGERVQKRQVDIPLTNVAALKEGSKVFSIDRDTGNLLQMRKPGMRQRFAQ
jgi:hypothetical protein